MTELPTDIPFDYQLAMDRLADYAAPRDKLRRLCAGGAVCRVKKGLYAPSRGGRSLVYPLLAEAMTFC